MEIEDGEKLYHVPPSNEVFEDLRVACIRVWCSAEHIYECPNQVLEMIRNIKNVNDNFMVMFSTLDVPNQRKIGLIIKQETKEEILKRLVANGSQTANLPF